MSVPALSIVVPTYNEAGNIRRLVERVSQALGETRFELIVVDDSTDGTEQLLREMVREMSFLRVIHRTDRRGLASAVTDGFALASGEVVCVLDADLQHPPEVVPTLVDALTRTAADLAIASRYVPGGGYALPPSRRVVSSVATVMARIALRRARRVADPVSGFFAFRRRVLDGVDLQPIGYKILLEILVRGRIGCVVEVPYRFEARGAGESKLTVRQHLEFVRHLLALCTVPTGPVDRVVDRQPRRVAQP